MWRDRQQLMLASATMADEVNPDGRSGSFALNDGTASGTWDCGTSPVR